MTLVIDLPAVLLVRVEARAQERGMALNEYVAKLIEGALPAEPNTRGVSLLEAWEAEDATDDPAELEARRADWEATKAALNEGHSSERKLFREPGGAPRCGSAGDGHCPPRAPSPAGRPAAAS